MSFKYTNLVTTFPETKSDSIDYVIIQGNRYPAPTEVRGNTVDPSGHAVIKRTDPTRPNKVRGNMAPIRPSIAQGNT